MAVVGPALSVDVLMPARTRPPAKIRGAVEALRGYLRVTICPAIVDAID